MVHTVRMIIGCPAGLLLSEGGLFLGVLVLQPRAQDLRDGDLGVALRGRQLELLVGG